MGNLTLRRIVNKHPLIKFLSCENEHIAPSRTLLSVIENNLQYLSVRNTKRNTLILSHLEIGQVRYCKKNRGTSNVQRPYFQPCGARFPSAGYAIPTQPRTGSDRSQPSLRSILRRNGYNLGRNQRARLSYDARKSAARSRKRHDKRTKKKKRERPERHRLCIVYDAIELLPNRPVNKERKVVVRGIFRRKGEHLRAQNL